MEKGGKMDIMYREQFNIVKHFIKFLKEKNVLEVYLGNLNNAKNKAKGSRADKVHDGIPLLQQGQVREKILRLPLVQREARAAAGCLNVAGSHRCGGMLMLFSMHRSDSR